MERGEIDIAAGLGVLCGEDMVPHRVLIEVGITGICGAVEEHLRHLEHVVGIARLGTVELVDVTVGIGLGKEVLIDTVAADADGAVGGHVGEEILCCLEI